MAFIDPEFYQGSPLQEQVDELATAEQTLSEEIEQTPSEEDALLSAQQEIARLEALLSEQTGGAQQQNTRLDLDNPVLRELQLLQQQNTQRAYLEEQRRETEKLEDRKSARDTLRNLFVVELGLPETLMEGVMQRLIDGDSDLAVAQWLRTTPEYKAQFPEMERRAALGLPRISEGESLALRRAYRSSLRQAGIDPIYYDEPIDFVEWIVGDVSEAELQTRIGIGEAALRQANAATKQQLKDLYNIDEPDLLAYYLDPVRTKDIFEAKLQLESAGISAASLRSTGEALGRTAAERLQSSNIAASQVEQRLSRRAGMLEDLLGSEGLTADVLAEGEFGTDMEASTQMRRRGEERLAPFQRQGSLLRTSEGITGFGEAT